MSVRTKNFIFLILLVGIGVVAIYGAWTTHSSDAPLLMAKSPRPEIMGTPQFNLTIVLRPDRADFVEDILATAEAAARTIDKQMSTYDPASPLSKFNATEAGKLVVLPAETRNILGRSRELWSQSSHAFDVTARPLIQLWKQCGKENRLPNDAEISKARQQSQWEYFEITDEGVKKTRQTAGVDFGGIAKGLAIDRAAEAMIRLGAVGGIVDIGGDVRCFGRKPSKELWRVKVANPFTGQAGEALCIVVVENFAVCTSGNYERFRLIGGKRFSHIINPTSGKPADLYPSVTVIARDTVTADAWATALSVLGPAGFELIPAESEIEAMVVVGTADKYDIRTTAGFNKFIAPSK